MTSFPGVNVESMKVGTPPFDEPGVVQEFVGHGVTREPPSMEVDTSDISEFVDNAKEMFGEFPKMFGEFPTGRYRIRYTLLIRGATEGPVSKRGAKATARAWTRAKNPFEVDVVNVHSVEIASDLSGDKLGTVYRVTTAVDK